MEATQQAVATPESAQAVPAADEAAKAAAQAKAQEEIKAKRFAEFARRERALRAEQSKIAEERKQWTAKQQEYEQKYVPRETLAKDPLKVLQDAGISYDELTKKMLNYTPPNQEVLALRQEFEQKLLEQQTNYQKQQEEQQQKAYQQAVGQIRNEAKKLVESSPEYEAIKAMNATEAVVALITETFNQTNEILDVSAAAEQVENYLVEEALKIANLNKIKSKLNPPSPDPVQPQKGTVQPKLTSGMKTLSTTAATTTKPLGDKERVQRAIAAFKGQL